MQNDNLYTDEDNLQTLGCPVAFWRFDSELKHVRVNTGDLYTQPAYPVAGKLITWDEVPENQRKIWEERILKVFQTGWRFIMEDCASTEKGAVRFQSTYMPEFDSKGSVVAVLVICFDISAARKMQEETEQPEVLAISAAAANSY